MNEEITLSERTNEYAWNLINENEEYTKEKYDEYVDTTLKDKEKMIKMFTDFSENEVVINEAHLIAGYSAFGRQFLDKVVEKDLASALNMFENITQMYIELGAFVNKVNKELENVKKDTNIGEK